MEKFVIHCGVAVPLVRNNIDTDAIIPSREMTRVSKQGLGEGLFAGWRYTLPGNREPNNEFILNRVEYANASVILAGSNFGCGSSREHAVWALYEYGVRVVIAQSFGTIFYNNCIRNGILPVCLSADDILVLANTVKPNPQLNKLTVDLPALTVSSKDGRQFHFKLDESHQQMLLEGLDSIALTMKMDAQISAFEQQDRLQRPWIYL